MNNRYEKFLHSEVDSSILPLAQTLAKIEMIDAPFLLRLVDCILSRRALLEKTLFGLGLVNYFQNDVRIFLKLRKMLPPFLRFLV